MTDEVYRLRCLRPDHVDVYDEHVLSSDYDRLRDLTEDIVEWMEYANAVAIQHSRMPQIPSLIRDARALLEKCKHPSAPCLQEQK